MGYKLFELTPEKMNAIELEFTKLVREHRKTIYTVCYFFSDNPTYVDDLFQEVLVNLWKGYAKFRGDSSLKTWIWRVSLNTCCKVERGKKRNVPTVPLLIDKDVLSESNEVGRQVKMLYDRINRLELFDRWASPLRLSQAGCSESRSNSNISYRILVILTVIAIALAVSVAGIATLMDIAELIKGSTLLTTVAVSAFGLSFHKMRK